VNDLESKIPRRAKDLIQKYASGLFRDATLEFYGIKTARIKEIINVELPVIEVGGGSADFVFLLEDGTYLHFEFQTTYNKKDLIRFAGYDLRLYERDGRRIVTVIIYAAGVKQAETELNIGSLTYRPEIINMEDYDGDVIFAELAAKINAEAEITDVDMLNLVFLPLMRNTLNRDELAISTIKLAQTIPDRNKRNACIASAIAFVNRYMDEEGFEKIKEALKMFDIVEMIVNEAVDEEKIEIAKKALKGGSTIEFIKMITDLDESTVIRLKNEIEATVA
jgi:hypothetical protein